MLTQQSIKVYAECISNFLEWTFYRNHCWSQVEFGEHVLGGYRRDMLSGDWSSRKTPLAPRTVNLRVQEACNFLAWAAEVGLRRPFTSDAVVPRQGDAHRVSRQPWESLSRRRRGKVAVAQTILRLPTDAELRRWLTSVRIERGQTKALMAELILKSAVRRQEAAAWRVDTLPARTDDWHVVNQQVRVTLKFGTKGSEYGEDHGDKVGPARDIWIPLSLANQLHAYRTGPRMAARARWVRAALDPSERRARIARDCPHLFLSDATGQRITAQSLYHAWTSVSGVPFLGWSPHSGRRYWACKTLVELARKRSELLPGGRTGVQLDWIAGNAMTDIQLIVRPQLGHVDVRTTEIYLTWLTRMFVGGDVQLAYAEHLEELCGEESHD
ncbi:site-specific integrase [Kinneretia aquatilis]|uniref:site-specific integrase n=1 Tax=Kinneretia aquatilis TaxID=2070761 RepID=UPI0014951526|nr:site-specific integrase [Paucibacter aquatile]WIV98450.1 site-specific integrase [Paucibacter aquatile]